MQNLSARQRTVGGVLEFSGIGVHSGQPVSLSIGPAPADSGYKIQRKFEDGSIVGPVAVHFARVVRTTLCTTIDLGDNPRWRGLQIVDVVGGTGDDVTGVVEFRATYVAGPGDVWAAGEICGAACRGVVWHLTPAGWQSVLWSWRPMATISSPPMTRSRSGCSKRMT